MTKQELNVRFKKSLNDLIEMAVKMTIYKKAQTTENFERLYELFNRWIVVYFGDVELTGITDRGILLCQTWRNFYAFGALDNNMDDLTFTLSLMGDVRNEYKI